MLFVDGQSNERLVLDGEWFEKLHGGQSKTRVPSSSFRSVTWQDIDRRVRLFSSEREQLVSVMLSFEGGPFVGFVAPADKRPQLEAIVAGLEVARTTT
ncbi:hypothetical protein AB0B66_34140 [Catellatospora sp. NPDC049111]|uniref:hypothetical protein n=1 Tax=Catellatospora sp. NPDC049111 TaxID=3155271 RepID=UPI0033D25065